MYIDFNRSRIRFEWILIRFMLILNRSQIGFDCILIGLISIFLGPQSGFRGRYSQLNSPLASGAPETL